MWAGVLHTVDYGNLASREPHRRPRKGDARIRGCRRVPVGEPGHSVQRRRRDQDPASAADFATTLSILREMHGSATAHDRRGLTAS